MAITLRQTAEAITEDCRRNAFVKTRCVVVFYRIVHYLACRSRLTLLAGAPLIVLYIVLCDWLMGIEIPVKTKIGKGLTIYHGTGLVINGFAVIGDYCTLRHGVTIGNTTRQDGTIDGVPTIGDHVEFGVHSVVLGPIRVGDRVRIGAGAVVLRDVPDGRVAVGVPARILDNGQEPK
ncbi:MAG: Serine acetyltransferase [Burkholderia lata]|uniref:Serine acetyltransferase n=1 Tax=Burkholderia lata (strain ATCC 17760 / DSM 23089 / LMG 22485 / NCIMB 9086 / R18194 / 383) TaxID=482957 RepID=A0A833PYM9_BURL3|nr:serine acetyltransferase [Burkholderia lata]KAF1040191.1 MAG: Serine acetyltransferase [Burkholderia lata]